MGTKNNPGQFDCYENADPNEPMFVLLGRDQDAPGLVNRWADQREQRGEDPEKVAEARHCAAQMFMYRLAGCPKTPEGPVKWGPCSRRDVYEVVDGERDYQDGLPATRSDGGDKSVGAFLALMQRYMTVALDDYAMNPGDAGALDVVRKITALGVACMEQHGAPARGQVRKVAAVVTRK